jgi:hypothetical protein
MIRAFCHAAATVCCCAVLTVPTAFAQGSPAKQRKANPSAPTAGVVDVNIASEKDLESLPGVTPAIAKKIVAGRPYSSVENLAKAGIPKATLAKIRGMVTVSIVPPSPTSAPPKRDGRMTGEPPTTPSRLPPTPGMVWVNLDTKVYLRQGDRDYGTTKHGKWMTEADAARAGYRASKTGAKK